MPRTIEHKIKLLDRPATPPLDNNRPSSEYGTFTRRDQFSSPQFPAEDWSMGNNRSSQRGNPPEKPARKFHYKSKQGDEVTYGTESFERNLRYSPNEIERQHFSNHSFGEQHSLGGGDGESRTSVRFEDEMKPARPIDATYDNPDPFAHRTHRSSDEFEEGEEGQVRLLHRSKHLDTSPIRIPRPKVDKNGSKSEFGSTKWQKEDRKALPAPFSFSTSAGPSRNSWRTSSSGFGHSEQEPNEKSSSPSIGAESASSGAYLAPNMPMKKVTRKSRWVSIHDGKPVTKFVETVHYEPAIGGEVAKVPSAARHSPQRHAHFGREMWTSSASSSSSCSLSSTDEVDEREKWDKMGQNQVASNYHHPSQSQSVYVTKNPVYSSLR